MYKHWKIRTKRKSWTIFKWEIMGLSETKKTREQLQISPVLYTKGEESIGRGRRIVQQNIYLVPMLIKYKGWMHCKAGACSGQIIVQFFFNAIWYRIAQFEDESYHTARIQGNNHIVLSACIKKWFTLGPSDGGSFFSAFSRSCSIATWRFR